MPRLHDELYSILQTLVRIHIVHLAGVASVAMLLVRGPAMTLCF